MANPPLVINGLKTQHNIDVEPNLVHDCCVLYPIAHDTVLIALLAAHLTKNWRFALAMSQAALESMELTDADIKLLHDVVMSGGTMKQVIAALNALKSKKQLAANLEGKAAEPSNKIRL